MKLIAEIKSASPFSSGDFRPGFDPVDLAQQYEALGASVISVVTAPSYRGNPEWIKQIRDKVKLRILRKDFISTVDELKQTADLGADLVLITTSLIADLDKLEDLIYQAWRLGLKPVVEVHTFSELARASKCDITRVLVNTRNIRDGVIEPGLLKYFAYKVPAKYETIAASGIKTREQMVEAEKLGYDFALVGEALMRSENLQATFDMLLGRTA